MTSRPIVSLDFETTSTADLRRTGAYLYARHPDTRVLCAAYAYGDQPVRIWRLGEQFPGALLHHVSNGGKVRAWNAAFELEVWNETLLRQLIEAGDVTVAANPDLYRLRASQLYDTMADAAYHGLPLSLDMASNAANVAFTKDAEGHSLMLRMARPRQVYPDGSMTWWHEDDPDRFDRLCDYCVSDVEAERAIADAIPELPAVERETWLLDTKINARGVHLDRRLIRSLIELAEEATALGNAELAALTGGAVKSVNAHAALLRYLHQFDYPFGNLQRGSVEERLAEEDCTGDERRALEIRADVARTSAAKLRAMLECATDVPGHPHHGLVRGMLQYYGAFRTGRWAGRLIQMQNLPRGSIPYGAIDPAVATILSGAGHDTVQALFGSVMGVVTSLLRACIIAGPGNELVSADFSQIEARVLPWLAGQESTLDVFRRGADIYRRAASGIFQTPTNNVNATQREVGKIAVLALGFGGGVGAFQSMAAVYGVKIPDAEADSIKVKWRGDNPHIVQLWRDLENAALRVLRNPARIEQVGQFLRVGMLGPHLVIVLPSGRGLFYRNAQIYHDTRFNREAIRYQGLDQYTRKWGWLNTYGGKLAENVTQATARDVMRDAMREADRRGHHLILTIHDELLAETKLGDGEKTLDDLLSIMRTTPNWAPGLPVNADGWHGARYRR